MPSVSTTSHPPGAPVDRGPRSPATLVGLTLVALAFFVGFAALGTWQVVRRTWKLDLIARVDQRVHAAATAPPGPAQWAGVTAAADEYRHVLVAGHFLNNLQTRVQASTDLGSGFWLMTPLVTSDGTTVLINQGYISAGWHASSAPAAANPVTVTGLLRMTEPHGAFLRKNAPAADHWFSRDVQAIASSRGLTRVAPYFIDAEAAPADNGSPSTVEPVGGLTVIAFHNSHLVYAITWYLLALMVAFGAWRVGREEQRLRSTSTPAPE